MRVELGDWQAMRHWAEPLRFAVFVESSRRLPRLSSIRSTLCPCTQLPSMLMAAQSAPGVCCPMGTSGMAVAKPVRGNGVGSGLLRVLMDEARRRGHTHTVLSAQTHATEFYQKHGYAAYGAEYDDAGIPHIDMRCAL